MQRLSDYPLVVVNVSCRLCPRRGRYALARLAARFGPDAPLDDVLAKLAGDCRSSHSKLRGSDRRCGARFEDLDRLPLRDVTADGPLHRLREIPREDIPRPRQSGAGSPAPPCRSSRENRAGSRGSPYATRPRHAALEAALEGEAMLSGWTAPRIAVVCGACRRREAFDAATVRAATVADVRLADLLRSLAARCPRLRPGASGKPCQARLEPDG